jgi:sodium/bile acid cotransporter 7
LEVPIAAAEDFFTANSFLVLVALAIGLAWLYPPLGATYLCPQITATWVAVVFIFFMAGLSMKTEELRKAFGRLYFNLFVQFFNFGVVSLIVFWFTRMILAMGGPLTPDLADAMMICASMPITVTMVIVMTKSAGGDEAAAVFNAAFGSLAGVFVSPALILAYTGVTGDVDLVTVFYKLALRVVLPVAFGQILHNYSTTVMEFVRLHKKHLKKCQEYSLIYIVYTVFCSTFAHNADESNKSTTKITDILWMGLFQLFLLCFVMVLAWFSLRLLFRDEPHLRIMGLYGCSQKSLAMGIPLINAIYEHNPKVGLYTLPLLLWHPLQLIIGSALAPHLAKSVDRVEAWQQAEAGRRMSQRALKRISLVVWESEPDFQELLLQEEEGEP